jgi:hypothetical protein
MNSLNILWIELLQKATTEHPRGNQGVADDLEISRTSISLVLNGKYPAKTDKIAAKVIDLYARLTCPHTGIEITHVACRMQSSSAVPTNSPQAMRHWRACQGCPHKGGK